MTPPVSPFARAVADWVRQRNLLESGARVLVAVSGGPDSCALLFALVEAADAGLLPRPVGAAHFHHGVRGRDADEEAGYVASLCAHLGLPCVVGLGHLPQRNGHYQSDVARQARYDFLAEASRDLGADTLATAHTQSDQAETVLWRIFRGTGLDGLGGIPARRQLSGTPDAPPLWLVRPLLGRSRDEVEAYCRAQNLSPRHDPSNDEDYYARVRMRRLLPQLAEQFNPRLPDALARLADLAQTDDDLLRSLAADTWNQCARVNDRSIELDAATLRPVHPALRKRVLLRAIRRAFRLADSPEAETAASLSSVARLEAALIGAPKGTLHLSGGLRARLRDGWLALQVDVPSAPSHAAAPLASVPLPLPGAVHFPPAHVTLQAALVNDPSVPLLRQRRSLTLDLALPQTVSLLSVRAVREGDRVAPLGMNGKTRLVRDILAEARVPSEARERYPVVTLPETGEILWVVGLVQAETTRVVPQTTRRVRLSATYDRAET